MAYKLIYGKKSRSELDEAITWYKDISNQTATKFYSAAQSRLNEISDQPHRFGPIRNRRRYRRAKIKRFPYLIVFRIDEAKQKVHIISIWHEKRNPSDLMKRLRK
ncbi:MAG TPA: type II toxin-antitoxin system RelE/ParE family toxin [Bacteroidetes bacterium]|nr:type II toxin-antitoxin system RelE/ParE family toxin [Bacteroidota bacterium]